MIHDLCHVNVIYSVYDAHDVLTFIAIIRSVNFIDVLLVDYWIID